MRAAPYTSYPWYRRRAPLVLLAILFPFLASLILLTGPVYYIADGRVLQYDHHTRVVVAVLTPIIMLPTAGVFGILFCALCDL
jgi:hypothetical protein